MKANYNLVEYEKKIFNIYFGLLKLFFLLLDVWFVYSLRIYLSFLVLTTHCFNPYKNNIHNKYIIRLLINNVPVPNFFIMSFYFCNKLFLKKDIEKIKQRFERLLIPYFIWPIIIWILNNLFYTTSKINLKIFLNDLKIQYLTGHNIVVVLWFQNNLIFSTLLMVIIEFLFNKNVLFILLFVQIFAYFLQYSNYNYKFFSKYKKPYKKLSFGRFFEIMPFCITGYILAYLKIIIFLKKVRIKSFFLILLISILILKYIIFIKIKGFYYQGIDLHILSVNIFIIISLLPSEKVKNMNIIKFIKIITKYTSGVYFLHVPISFYLKNYILSIKNQSLIGCLIIYIFCYFICFIGVKLFGKTKLRHLFQ